MIEKDIKDLDILMCYGGSLLSKAIRLITRSRISHNALAIKIDTEIYIIDAQRRGVNITRFREWHRKYKYNFYIVRLKETSNIFYKQAVKERAKESIGITKYDFASLLLWQPLYLITGYWPIKKIQNSKKRFYCSEFVAYCLNLPYPYTYSPEALYKYFKENKDYTLFYPMGDGFFFD